MSKYICNRGHIFDGENIKMQSALEASIDPSGLVEYGSCPICGEDFEEAIKCPICGEYFAEDDMEHGFCSECASKITFEDIDEFCEKEKLTVDELELPAWVTYFLDDYDITRICKDYIIQMATNKVGNIDRACFIGGIQNFLYNYGDELAEFKEEQNG